MYRVYLEMVRIEFPQAKNQERFLLINSKGLHLTMLYGGRGAGESWRPGSSVTPCGSHTYWSDLGRREMETRITEGSSRSMVCPGAGPLVIKQEFA